MTHDEMIAVIAADKEFKPIQMRDRLAERLSDSPSWIPYAGCQAALGFDFQQFEYRIKPEPVKPREWWIVDDPPLAHAYSSEQNAGICKLSSTSPIIHVREVLPDEGRAQ